MTGLPDVTARAAGFTLARSSNLEEIGDLLDSGVMTLDRQGVVAGWNRWLEQATGIRAADAIGMSVTDPSLRVRASAYAPLLRAAAGGAAVLSHALHEYVIEARPPAGQERFQRMQQSARVIPLANDAGESMGAVVFIDDVTERVSRESELRQAVEAAEQATRAKSDFLAAMSHELRTPIGAIAGYVSLLADGVIGSVTEPQRDYLLRVKSVASHLSSIVGSILDFARVEAGREETTFSEIEVTELAADALNAVEPLALQKGLSVRRTFAPDAVVVRTDEVKVRQILINLLGNAVKFTDRGTIELRVTADADEVSFDVIDSGCGIAPQDQARIFEPFTQVANSRERMRQGTGLGLSVSRGLAKLVGGSVTVISEPGVGSTFTLHLPRTNA
jgi:PAS domain S-box-containing protein